MDRNAHAELTLVALDHRSDAAKARAMVEHHSRTHEQTQAALQTARKALARRSLISRVLSFFGA